MAYNKKLTERVRAAFEKLAVHAEEKKMFRGVAFMVNGKMCITAGDDALMCRIDPDLHEEAIGKEGCTTKIMKGRPYPGYVMVQEEAIKTERQLMYWIRLALDFNPKAKASVKRKK